MDGRPDPDALAAAWVQGAAAAGGHHPDMWQDHLNSWRPPAEQPAPGFGGGSGGWQYVDEPPVAAPGFGENWRPLQFAMIGEDEQWDAERGEEEQKRPEIDVVAQAVALREQYEGRHPPPLSEFVSLVELSRNDGSAAHIALGVLLARARKVRGAKGDDAERSA